MGRGLQGVWASGGKKGGPTRGTQNQSTARKVERSHELFLVSYAELQFCVSLLLIK
jgi:hypothetical protein